MTGSPENRRGQVSSSSGEVGVREDDSRRLSTQLERDRLQVRLARHLLNELPDSKRAGEGDPADSHVRGEDCANGGPVTRENLNDSRWEAGFQGELSEHERCKRRFLGGLDDDRVACAHCRIFHTYISIGNAVE